MGTREIRRWVHITLIEGDPPASVAYTDIIGRGINHLPFEGTEPPYRLGHPAQDMECVYCRRWLSRWFTASPSSGQPQRRARLKELKLVILLGIYKSDIYASCTRFTRRTCK